MVTLKSLILFSIVSSESTARGEDGQYQQPQHPSHAQAPRWNNEVLRQ